MLEQSLLPPNTNIITQQNLYITQNFCYLYERDFKLAIKYIPTENAQKCMSTWQVNRDKFEEKLKCCK